jgi:hypothetical protein
MCEEAGISPRAISLKLLVPLLENVSLEDDPDDPAADPEEAEAMHERWAAMLANAAADDAGADVPPSFPIILSELETKEILGVRCTVVRDTVSERGKAIERIFDWYAQDRQGNVWYMGEDSLELKNGRFVRASDSWRSGVRGAKPGIIMRGHPRAGDVYRQEYYPPGGALDQARVLGRGATVKVPYGLVARPLVTIEWSPVEPQFEKKYYESGVGEIKEQVVRGQHEQFQLVSVTH